jgi:hypothetical protein
MHLARVQVLNTMYAQTGVTFTLAATDTDRTTNAAWYTANQNSPEWVEMTNALHKGGVQVAPVGKGRIYACARRTCTSGLGYVQARCTSHCPLAVQDLNLYSMNLPFPLLGWSQFPWWYAGAPKQVQIGILLRSSGPLLHVMSHVCCVVQLVAAQQHGAWPVTLSNRIVPSCCAQDGVFFDLDTMPGGATPSFNLGMTATHEVGHW